MPTCTSTSGLGRVGVNLTAKRLFLFPLESRQTLPWSRIFVFGIAAVRTGAVQSFAAGETVADVSHARILSKSAGSEHRWHGGPVGYALGEAGGGHRVCAPGVGPPVPCGQVLLGGGCSHVRVTGQGVCRAKCHFALFGVPSVQAGRAVPSLNSSAPMGRTKENQRLTEELAATREALRQVNRSEPRP